MARNIFSIYDLSILLKLSILFVGKVKFTPFNGSIFFNGSRPFLRGTSTLEAWFDSQHSTCKWR
jgi:hypothetical protein